MKVPQNLHTHTVFDDGHNTPMEMAQAALDAGLHSLGFSAHSTLPYDDDWMLTDETVPDYLAAIAATREAFAGRLAIYNGLELDSISEQSTDGFDYIIGSLHHIAMDGHTPTIDYTAEITKTTMEEYFHGDEKAMIRAFFAQYANMAADDRIDIVGHFDLLCKFWETDGLFDPDGAYFQACALEAMEPLARAGKIFEVNTGAISRGYRRDPYPCPSLLRALRSMGGRVLISSDSHEVRTIASHFAETEQLLRDIGFDTLWMFNGKTFIDTGLK